mmetsp:Transcript_15514/g.18678  ORF Transcript_15514/g.18678 Transcript_15514/m.18678 type:complete len:109 (+) Transcript_15514:253-579(+)
MRVMLSQHTSEMLIMMLVFNDRSHQANTTEPKQMRARAILKELSMAPLQPSFVTIMAVMIQMPQCICRYIGDSLEEPKVTWRKRRKKVYAMRVLYLPKCQTPKVRLPL